MKTNVLGRNLQITQALLAAALLGAVICIRAGETPPEPLFPGIIPVCPCENLTNV